MTIGVKVWVCKSCSGQDDCVSNMAHNCLNNATWIETDKYQIIERPKEKQPELMTLQEAFDKMEPGDSFKNTSNGEVYVMARNGYLKYGGSGEIVLLQSCHFNMKGKIIPAEPVILSAEGWIEKRKELLTDGKVVSMVTYYEKDLYDCAEFFNKQQWLNHKPLREAAENVVKFYPNVDRMDIPALATTLKNLKPLNTE